MGDGERRKEGEDGLSGDCCWSAVRAGRRRSMGREGEDGARIGGREEERNSTGYSCHF